MTQHSLPKQPHAGASDALMTLCADWLPDAERIMSPNVDARPPGVEIDALVIHSISLPPGDYGGPEIAELFTNQLDPTAHPYFANIADLKVSAHVLIRRDGHVVQFAALSARAWHAGPSELQGRPRCNDFSIGIELEGTDTDVFTGAQYQSLIRITRQIQGSYPTITPARIVGHSDIAPGRKTDPGRGFDWSRYRAGIDDNASRGQAA